MALKIYGAARSRTLRVLWLAHELKLTFEHIALSHDDPALKAAAFLALNPAGKIPVMVDDGFALSESLAINLYLAKQYGSSGDEPMYPAKPEDEARTLSWCLWSQASLEPWLQSDALPPALRRAIDDNCQVAAQPAMAMLDAVLAQRCWLVRDWFTVADLNVAAVLSPSRSAKLDMAAYPQVQDWLTRCYGRPAAIATRRAYEI